MTSHSENEISPSGQIALINSGLWDIDDLSSYLKVKVKTLYAMVREIPHYRVGKLIRFKKQEIDHWLEGKRKGKREEKKPRIQSRRMNVDLDHLIQKTIDREKSQEYNSSYGKSDQIKGLGKEV